MIYLSLSSPALALDDSIATNPDVTIINLSENITHQELQEIARCATAQITKDDGTVVPIEAVITVEDLTDQDLIATNYLRNSSIADNSYKVTLSATASQDKIDSDSGSRNGTEYNVSATLQLIWTDVFGTENKIKEVSGTLTILKGNVSDDSYVQWGNFYSNRMTWGMV